VSSLCLPHFSDHASPLVALTKKDAPFIWGPAQRNAFERLKDALCSDQVLAYPKRTNDPDEHFVLDTDASLVALGGVLSQIQNGKERVIAYASKTLSKEQQAYCTTKRELLAVVYFCELFRPYLAMTKFELHTDHASLKWLVNFKAADGMLLCWIIRLQCFNFDMVHRAGKDHQNADSLSRMVRQKCG